VQILTIVLLVLLALFFMLSVFLATRQYETDRHQIFLAHTGLLRDSSQALAPQKLREKYFEEVALQHLPAPYREHFLRSPSGRIETPFSQGLSNRKDMKMSTHIDAKKQDEMTAHTESIEFNGKELANYGFTSAEVASLIWLQKWYQSGGSDRMVLVRHWEFLRLLVLNGKLDM